jgi:hypothetical protein
MSTASTVTIAYAATVTASGVQVITNNAQISAIATGPLVRSTTVIANGLSLYLPLIRR